MITETRHTQIGHKVWSMSAQELSALIDFSFVGKSRWFPLSIIGLSNEKVIDMAPSGYEALIADGEMARNVDGTITLDDTVEDSSVNTASPVPTLIMCLMMTTSVIRIRLVSGRSSLIFLILKNGNSWSIIWRSKGSYRVVVGFLPETLTGAYRALTSSVMSKKSATTAVEVTYMSSTGDVMGTTMLTSEDVGQHDALMFIEEKPGSSVFPALEVGEWPAFYSVYEADERISDILMQG